MRGRLEPLPPYSPDLNLIEQCWAKLKTALRQARTRPTLDAALKRALQRRSLPPMRRPGSLIVVILYIHR
jgi:transposase